MLPDYNKGDTAKKEFTRQVWYETRERLLKIIQEFAKKVIRNENSLRKYSMSCEYGCRRLLTSNVEQILIKSFRRDSKTYTTKSFLNNHEEI